MQIFKYLTMAVALTGLAGTALAKDSAYRTALASSSAAMNIARDLDGRVRAEGPGRTTALGNISALMSEEIPTAASAGSAQTRSGDDYVMLQGDGWTLDVRGDGTWVRYATETRGRPEVSADKRMSADELERLGKNFIAEVLSSQIVLLPDERLEAWRTSYEMSVGGVPGGEVQRKVVSNRIVFTRVIASTPVVGPGSKISVTFDNNRQVVEFQYDWSPLVKYPQTQKSAPAELVRARLDEILARRSQSRSSATMEQIECGYYDSGALGDGKSELQAGCVAKHVMQTNGLKSAIVSSVPATEKVVKRADWPETLMITK